MAILIIGVARNYLTALAKDGFFIATFHFFSLLFAGIRMIGSKASVKKYSIKQRNSLNICLPESGYDIRDKLFQKTQKSNMVGYIPTIIVSEAAGYMDRKPIFRALCGSI
jgi:small basic protein